MKKQQSHRESMTLGLTLAMFAGLAVDTFAADASPSQRPNILWITSEDICPNLGCYGDPDAITPNLDKFATAGIRFTNAFSVHPCCSPSRSCLATGVYPTRMGTFQHGGKMRVNAELVKCFPTLLREAGYYTFNGTKGGVAKLDYNFDFDRKDEPWDKLYSTEIEWRNRKPGQPFFGQVNLKCTHQSQYGLRRPGAPVDEQMLAKKGYWPLPPRTHEPAKIHVPPYHPDTPAVREIWTEYHDRITQMDQQFADLLAMLEKDGLTDDTIVFFFGDNGHGIPGGKIWLWDQGPHVPFIVYVPKKWQHLVSAQPGTVSDQMVSFLDFAPTVLSLAGVDIPSDMQGVAFAGPKAGPARKYAFAARDAHDGADFDTSRMVRDGRYHYIRNFMPHIGWDAIQFSWRRAPYMLDEWRQQAADGKLQADTRQAGFFRRTKPVEELYDMEKDRYQMHNLADDPQYQDVLKRMRSECEKWMTENRDLGLLSQYELYTRSQKDSPYEMGMDPKRNPIQPLLAAANLANRRAPAAIGQLVDLLEDDDSAVRRWGAIGLLALHEKGAPATDALLAALKDPSPDVQMTAAEALCGLEQADRAVPVLITLLSHPNKIVRNQTLLALCRIGPPAKAALPHLKESLVGAQPLHLWSYDNIPDSVALATVCLSNRDDAKFKPTREKYLP